MSAWQPIESAPKDGAEVDLWGNDFETGLTHKAAEGYRVTNARWHPETYKPEEVKYGIKFSHYWFGASQSYRPTHWMPIPASPLTERTRSKGDRG